MVSRLGVVVLPGGVAAKIMAVHKITDRLIEIIKIKDTV
jgi:hypothetical protein